MSRKLHDFIEGFMHFTEGKGSSYLYRLWTGIFMVGAACERKVWLTTVKGKLYPNQYILLVGGAGIGKSLCTNLAYDFLDTIRTPDTPFHIAPTSVTKASLIDALASAERRVVRPMEIPSVNAFNSLSVVANEFGVFLPSWESEFMSVLTDLWDCRRYAETRRTAKIKLEIPNTQLNLLSADTPAHLTNLLPEGAWEQGFMSRILIVYSGENIYTDLFAEFDLDKELEENLIHDLKEIYSLWGEVEVTEEAKIAISEWAAKGGPPIPDHPKLQHYCSRRAAHLLKLCIIASVSNDSEKIVTVEHFSKALSWLIELESFMPDVFKSMKIGGDGRVMEECWHFIYQIYMKEGKKPVAEHRIWRFLQERTPAHNIERMLNAMERGKLLEKKFTESGGHGYVPKSKHIS